jgi:hypothetical protein
MENLKATIVAELSVAKNKSDLVALLEWALTKAQGLNVQAPQEIHEQFN